ncbi:MAG: peptidase [Cyclobacteriaceae bacterium]|nr:MAG: peptidase [Cyclobacteriaceae bacterium]
MIIRLLLLFIVFPVLASDNYPRNEAVDITRYIFRIELNDTTNRIGGMATIRFYSRKAIQELEVDLAGDASGKGMQVEEVRLQGRLIIFNHHNNRLKMLFPVQIPQGQESEITIRYAGIPADGLIISRNRYGERTFFGDNWPDRARHWLPCIDHPYDKAAVEFIVIAPPHYQVVANGIRTEESYLTNRQKLTHWREDVPLPTKVMVIGVSRFAIRLLGMVNHIPVEAWVYPQNRDEGFSDYAPAVKVLRFFDSLLAPYPYRKLANVQSTTRYGGMENANTIFYFENSVSGKGQVEGLIAHEIAHQWFGNSASEGDWHHVWLSEGFATYFTHVYMEHTYGLERRKELMKRDRNRVIDHCAKMPAPVIDTHITHFPDLLSPHVYERASWVLHMLRRQVGDSAFFAGIRLYYKTFSFGNARTEDFRKIMETTSGQNLETFFRQWLYEIPIPRLRISWQYQNGKVDINISQVQPEPAFYITLEAGLTFSDGEERIEKLVITRKNQTFSLPVPSRPVRITPDPGVNLLFEEVKGY